LFSVFSCDKNAKFSEFDKTQNKFAQREVKFIVSPEDAMRVAGMFDMSGNGNVSSGLRNSKSAGTTNGRTAKELLTVKNAKNESAMYIVNYSDNKGFIIISATKKYYPVLAYFDKGNFTITDNMPYGVSMWMDETKADMDYQESNATDSTVKPNTKIGHAWVCDGYRRSVYYTEHFLRLPVNYLVSLKKPLHF